MLLHNKCFRWAGIVSWGIWNSPLREWGSGDYIGKILLSFYEEPKYKGHMYSLHPKKLFMCFVLLTFLNGQMPELHGFRDFVPIYKLLVILYHHTSSCVVLKTIIAQLLMRTLESRPRYRLGVLRTSTKTSPSVRPPSTHDPVTTFTSARGSHGEADAEGPRRQEDDKNGDNTESRHQVRRGAPLKTKHITVFTPAVTNGLPRSAGTVSPGQTANKSRTPVSSRN